jgi:hypothetical protein
MQLAYSEGCAERPCWLSSCAMSAPIQLRHRRETGRSFNAASGQEEGSSSGNGGGSNGPVTHAEATSCLMAGLLTLRLPGAAVFDAPVASLACSRPGGPPAWEDMLAWCRAGAGLLCQSSSAGAVAPWPAATGKPAAKGSQLASSSSSSSSSGGGGGDDGDGDGDGGVHGQGERIAGSAAAFDDLIGCLQGLLSVAEQAQEGGCTRGAAALFGALKEVITLACQGCRRLGRPAVVSSPLLMPTQSNKESSRARRPPAGWPACFAELFDCPQVPEAAVHGLLRRACLRLLCLLSGEVPGLHPSAAAALACR